MQTFIVVQSQAKSVIHKKGDRKMIKITKKPLKNLRVVRWFWLLFWDFQLLQHWSLHNLQLKRRWNLVGFELHERSWVFDRFPSVYLAQAVRNSFAVLSSQNLRFEEPRNRWNPLVLLCQRLRFCQDHPNLGLDRREHLGTLQLPEFWRRPEISKDSKSTNQQTITKTAKTQWPIKFSSMR